VAAARTSAASCGSREADHWLMPSRLLRAKLALISQKINLAEAIRYALSRWQGLTRFIDDGRNELDNNTVERSTRGIKISRRTHYLLDPTVVPNIGLSSRPRSRPARSTMLIRSPISPMS
jgi:Transposase IS66 family